MITAEAAARVAGLFADTKETFQETPLKPASSAIRTIGALPGGVGRPDR
jgi:hypothetical protein